MAASSSFVGTLEHSMSLPEAVSTALESLPSMSSVLPSAQVLANSTSTAIEQVGVKRSWLGMFGQMTLFLIKVFPSVLYWIITFTTITMPTFLFTLFSTSLTFTMNATTLYVRPPHLLSITNIS
jgi:lysophospholipid hydrolase